MEKINKLVLCLLPNQICNFKCEYCYISQLNEWNAPEILRYTPEYMAKCLSKERLGGTSLINLTGEGETFLSPKINEIILAFLKEGHYVEVVTNGTVRTRIDNLLNNSEELLSRLFFKISFHYKELKQKKMLGLFFDTIDKIRSSPASFTLELMAYDGIENDIEDIQNICMENVGALCHLTVGRNDKLKNKGLLSEHDKEEYWKIWKSFNSAMFDFKMQVLGVKRKEFCYAGAWSLSVNLYTGECQPCYWQPYTQNIFEDPKKPIKFIPVGKHCTLPYCYNAHAHMTWGLLPSIETPYYCEMRDRVTCDDIHWLKSNCSSFFSSKLSDSNAEYSAVQKVGFSLMLPFRYIRWAGRDFKGNAKRIRKYINRRIDEE